MDDQKLYDIRVRIRRGSNAITVYSVTSEKAHEVAANMCAAWGRRVPDVMADVERWAAELGETGAFDFENSEVEILVKRSA